ncbi:putative Mannosyl-oligosaccharide 1,2-alpha-mannosidase MNS1 [Blattamonas nauphoetae]|uniref:alpha-1,2-Mannosidase n=1 Tax=Blattamonas nauphoetae TaxID=2049346 RepID=A0ABQ9XRX0_9EUKA|nr:putative Mannosyl-oligosaccharide 1,2-alpha-mannosidase MNS1 [Blattamonas nauphoetae]
MIQLCLIIHLTLSIDCFLINPSTSFSRNMPGTRLTSIQKMLPLSRNLPKYQSINETHEQYDDRKPLKPIHVSPSSPQDLLRYSDIYESPPAGRWPKLPNETKCQERREAVKRAFLYAWEPYERYAFGHDELFPLSKKPNNWLGNQGTTIIDSIGTLKIMGLEEEYKKCRNWVKNKNKVYKGGSANLFETGIRILAGFISAYDITGEEFYLTKAEEIGDAIIVEFENHPTFFIPQNTVSLKKPTRTPSFEQRKIDIFNDKSRNILDFYTPNSTDLYHNKTLSGSQSNAWLAEFGLFFEFVGLSDRTGDEHYAKFALRAAQTTLAAPRANPAHIRSGIGIESGREFGIFTLGAPADSFFEYLIKTDILTHPNTITMRGSEPGDKTLSEWWTQSMLAFANTTRYMPSGDIYLGSPFPHLTCFAGGNMALGAFFLNDWKLPYLSNTPLSDIFRLGADLTKTCYHMYSNSPSKLAGEFARTDGTFTPVEENKLRPETVESLFYLFRMTGDEKYQDWAWEIFEAFEAKSKLPLDSSGRAAGYTTRRDLTNPQPTAVDELPSFFYSETLKYLYLIFCDPSSVMPLDQWVFSTEAHPFVRRKYLKTRCMDKLFKEKPAV